MATVVNSCMTQIGETAGQVWHALDENGPLTLTKLIKLVGAPRDLTLQAIGWLAREGKIDIEDNGRTRRITLR